MLDVGGICAAAGAVELDDGAVEDVAALAIAAPPIAAAATAAPVTSTDLMFLIFLLWGCFARRGRACWASMRNLLEQR
jgi:hypothetical protein